jgi:hypothetical protein
MKRGILAELATKCHSIFHHFLTSLLSVQRAFHRPYSFLPQDMGIDHGGGYILVTEQFLHGANIGAFHEKMRGKGMPQCVRRYPLIDTGLFCSSFHRPLQSTLVHMVAPLYPGLWIDSNIPGSKQELPTKFPMGIFKLSF